MNALQQRVGRILDKLSEARARRCSCFGSDHHRFRLNAPLEEAELQGFETAHGIELPGCYRAFLRHAGNGGAGPYYGIYQLGYRSEFAEWVVRKLPDGFLASSSPLRPGRNAGPDIASGLGVQATYVGTLPIGTQGCTCGMRLIVTGPSRGRIAYVDDESSSAFVVRDEDFLSWYERWLDELLSGYETEWFGFSPPGAEGELLAILDNAEADSQLRGEAAWALRRLPRLSEPTRARITQYLGDPLAEVRSGACAAVRRFAVGSAIERVADLLEDAAAEARRQAACTLVEQAPQRWAEAIRQLMLRETDQGVASSVFFSLKNAGRLGTEELLHIIKTGRSSSVRASAIWALDWSRLGLEHADLATRLLSDSDRGVRLQAALGLRRSKIQLPTSLVVACLEREADPWIIEHFLELLGRQADPKGSEALLTWAASGDDFHRLCALSGLLRIGDPRAIPIAMRMLQERRRPIRKEGMSSILTIRSLVWRALLRETPRGLLRSMVRRIRTGS